MEDLISCPYNPCHQIKPSRIQYHLIKCARQHPHLDMAVCPYNATHHVPRAREQEHIIECPDRRIVELQRHRFNQPLPGQHGNLSNPLVYGSSLIPVQDAGQDDDDLQTFSEAELRTGHRSYCRDETPSLLGASEAGLPPRDYPFGRGRKEDEGTDAEVEALTAKEQERGRQRMRATSRMTPRMTGDGVIYRLSGAGRKTRSASRSPSVSSSTRIQGKFMEDKKKAKATKAEKKVLTSSVRGLSPPSSVSSFPRGGARPSRHGAPSEISEIPQKIPASEQEEADRLWEEEEDLRNRMERLPAPSSGGRGRGRGAGWPDPGPPPSEVLSAPRGSGRGNIRRRLLAERRASRCGDTASEATTAAPPLTLDADATMDADEFDQIPVDHY